MAARPPRIRLPTGAGILSNPVTAVPAADVASFAFTDYGPSVIEPAERTRPRAEATKLLQRRRLPPGRRVIRVTAQLGGAVGRGYIAARRRGGTESRADLSRRLRHAFERLGPTYIKLGQIVSSGEGLFPEELVNQFKLLRDHVRAETFETVRQIVEVDLGRPLEAVFAHFEPQPVAAASIAQVHRARP